MRRRWRERFPHHRIPRKPLVSDPVMHRGTCVAHVLWCMSGAATRGGGKNVPGIPGACATRNFTYLARGPWFNRIGSRFNMLRDNKARIQPIIWTYEIGRAITCLGMHYGELDWLYLTRSLHLLFSAWWRHQMETFPALLDLCAVNYTKASDADFWCFL